MSTENEYRDWVSKLRQLAKEASNNSDPNQSALGWLLREQHLERHLNSEPEAPWEALRKANARITELETALAMRTTTQVSVPMNRESYLAVRESAMCEVWERYSAARELQANTMAERHFCSGFNRGWDSRSEFRPPQSGTSNGTNVGSASSGVGCDTRDCRAENPPSTKSTT